MIPFNKDAIITRRDVITHSRQQAGNMDVCVIRLCQDFRNAIPPSRVSDPFFLSGSGYQISLDPVSTPKSRS